MNDGVKMSATENLLCKLWRVLFILSFVALIGCTAYRLSGFLESGPRMTQPVLTHKYRLESVSLRQDCTGGYILHVPETVAKEEGDEIRHRIEERFPSVFTREETGIPIDVELVEEFVHREGDLTFFIYICSFGVLPKWQDFYTNCRVFVRKHDNGEIIGTEGTPFSGSCMLSVSPIGLIGYDPHVGAQASRCGNGIFFHLPISGGSFSSNARAVYVDTYAAAVVSALERYEVPRVSEPQPAQRVSGTSAQPPSPSVASDTQPSATVSAPPSSQPAPLRPDAALLLQQQMLTNQAMQQQMMQQQMQMMMMNNNMQAPSPYMPMTSSPRFKANYKRICTQHQLEYDIRYGSGCAQCKAASYSLEPTFICPKHRISYKAGQTCPRCP